MAIQILSGLYASLNLCAVPKLHYMFFPLKIGINMAENKIDFSWDLVKQGKCESNRLHT